jgi:hypothetical protein
MIVIFSFMNIFIFINTHQKTVNSLQNTDKHIYYIFHLYLRYIINNLSTNMIGTTW